MGFFDQIVNRSSGGGGGEGGGGGGGYAPSGSSNQGWQAFNALRQQIADRNQQLLGQSGPDYFAGTQAGPSAWQGYVDNYNRQNDIRRDNQRDRGMFSMSGGTKSMYNDKYRKANMWDTAAIKAGEAGEWWMNLPSNIADMAGNQQLAQDLKFDASKFDLSNGLDMGDLQQVGNFALSIPGMIPGGIFEGVEKGYEALTGAPVQEHRKTKDGGYEVADYTLDFNQRAAAGIDAAIDIGGTFFGGSGKAISVVGKGLGRAAANRAERQAVRELEGATTREAADAALHRWETANERAQRLHDRSQRIAQTTANAGNGLLSTAAERSGLGRAAQFGANVAEEAGEEFVQSYMEDFRNKEYDPAGSFDKALTSAAWGAVGGGLMHGLGAAGNAVFHGRYDAEHRDQTTDGATDPIQETNAAFARAREFERFSERNAGYGEGHYTEAVRKAADERVKQPDKIPASCSAFGTVFNDDLNSKQCRITLGMLDGMCDMDDNGRSLAGLAQRFGTTVENVQEIRSIRAPEQRLARWLDLLNAEKARNGRVKIRAGRNPDTNRIGVADMDVVDIVLGNGVQMNAQAWKMLGGDVDGDRYQTYFSSLTGDDPVRSTGYLVRNLLDTSNGEATMDKDYITYLGSRSDMTDADRSRATTCFRNAFQEAMRDNGHERMFDQRQFEGYISDFTEANNAGINQLSSFYDRLYWGIYNALDANMTSSQRHDVAGDILADAMHGTHKKFTETQSTYAQVVGELSEDARRRIEEAGQLVEESDAFLSSGNNLGKRSAAEFIGLFGKRIALAVGADLGGNSVMRQSAVFKFESYKEQDVWFDQSLTNEQVQNRFERLIAFAFSLENVGEDVQNSIEGVFWTSVVDSVMTRFTANDTRIGLSEDSWNSFLDILIEEYNSKVKDFNEVISRPSTVHDMDVLIGSKKKMIDKASKADIAQVFHRAFGNMEIGSLVSLDASNPLHNVTFNQLVDEYAKCRGADYGPFTNYPGFGKFFKYLVSDYNATYRALQSRYEDTIQQMGHKIAQFGFTDVDNLVRVTRDDDGNISNVEITAQDRYALIEAVEAAHYIIGGDECITLGINTVEGFLTTHWGREWMSGDPARMENVVLAAKITHMYRDAMNLFVRRPDNWENDIEIELRDKAANGGLLEMAVLSDWVNHHDLGFLRILQDLDTRFDEKEQIWEQSMENMDKNTAHSLLAELFSTGNEDIGTSMFTQQLKSAKRHMVLASKRSNAHNRSVLEDVRHLSVSDSVKLDAMKNFLTDAYTTTSANAMAAFIHSQREVVKGMVEKGVAPTTADIFYQMRQDVLNGGLFSSLEDIDLACGSMTVGKLQTNRVQLLKVLSDPSIKMRAYDQQNGGYVWLTRDAIFREVLGDNNLDPDTQWEAWDRLFEACPQLVSLCTPTHVGVQTVDGTPSINEGTQLPLDKAIISYDQSRQNADGYWMHRQHRNRAFHVAMGDPNWWGVLVADPRFDDSQSLAQTKDIVNKALNENLDWLLSVASLNPCGADYYNLVASLGRSAMGQMFEPIRKIARDIDTQQTLNQLTGGFDSGFASRLAVDVMNACSSNAVTYMLASHGLYVDGGVIRHFSSKKERKRYEAEAERRFMQSLSDSVNQSAEESLEQGSDIATAICDYILGSFDDSKHLMYTLLNMVDQGMFNVPEHLRANRIFDGLQTQLEQYIAANTDEDGNVDPDAQQRVNQVLADMGSYENGGLGGFTSLMFGIDIMDMIGGEYTDVITLQEAATLSEEEFIGKVHGICDTYNFNEDREKIDRDIRNAFGIQNVDERMRRLNNIKNYYNQVIVEYLLKKIVPSGNVYNLSASKQTMEAYQTMLSIADKVRDELGNDLVPNPEGVKELNIDYTSPVTSCMSQHMSMNAASGGITTGIGMNGSMLNLIGGLGLIREMEPIDIDATSIDSSYYGWTCTYQDEQGQEVTETITHGNEARLQSMGTVSVSREGFIGDSLETLINFMQEAMNLKAKKSLGAIRAFSDPTQIDRTMSDDITPATVSRNIYGGRDMTMREFVRGALQMRRTQVENHLMRWYQSDECSGLHFGERHAKTFANVMVNLVEVRVAPDEAAGVQGGVFYVSSSALSDDETFNGRYDFGYGPGVMPPTANVNVRPVVMGLQEVSEKIVRNVSGNYYAQYDQGHRPTEDEVLGWARDGMENFDNYNQSPVSIRSFLDGIQPNPPKIDNAMLGDVVYSGRMLWNDQRTGTMQSTFKQPDSISKHPEMSGESWRGVQSFNSLVMQRSNDPDGKGFFGSNRIVTYHTDKGQMTPFAADARSTLPTPKDVGGASVKYDEHTQLRLNLIDMYDGTSAKSAKRYYEDAKKGNRPLLMRQDVATTLAQDNDRFAFDMLNGVTLSLFDGFANQNVSYVLVDPRGREYMESFRRENMTIATTSMEPEEISIAMGTKRKLGLPDAGHLHHPDFKTGKLYQDAVDITPSRILKQGFGEVRLVTNLQEIASITADQIDFSYYENNTQNKALHVFQDNATSFIDRMRERARRGELEYPRCLNDVQRDECVGFIRQARSDGTYVYAPIFYEGSVAGVAKTVVITQGNRGFIRLSYASENVNYGGNESQKIDLYGVAYKTVGHEASAEDLRKWAALDTNGFGIEPRADIMFDENSVQSRLFELGDTILHNNMVYFTRKTGINAFFKKDGNGNWILRDDLHRDITDHPSVLRDLIAGDEGTWRAIAQGRLHVYRDVNVNSRFAKAVEDIQGVGGYAHLLFNTARIELDGNGNAVFKGLERRNFEPNAVFKYWNTDDFLALWNHLDSRLCPPDLNTDAGRCIFDRQGRMLDRNTISGEPERCVTIVGPNFYSGEGTAISDLSRGATWSNQHIIKRLLADGLYRGDIRGTIDALSLSINRIDRTIPEQSQDEEIEEWRRHRRPAHNPEVDPEMLARVSDAMSDPLYLSVIDRRKQALNEKIEDLYSPVHIVVSVKNQEPALNDAKNREQIDRAVAALNEALGGPSLPNMLTMSEVMMLVRLETGFTTNASGGIKTLTIGQFVDAVNQMVQNLQQHERIIIGGRYRTRGDARCSIPLMPRGLASRLSNTPLYQRRFNGDVDAIINEQLEDLDASVEFIKTMDDKAKMHELMQLADAMCISNGRPQVSGHLMDGVYIYDVIQSVRNFGLALQDADPNIISQYDEALRLNDEWAARMYDAVSKYKHSRVHVGNGEYETIMTTNDERSIITYALRQLSAVRKTMGLTYLEMPLSNILDRSVGQMTKGWAYSLGRHGIGPYVVNTRMNEDLRENVVKNPELKKFWSALREAQLLGVDRELLAHVYNGQSLDEAIASTLKEQSAIERFSQKVMNIASGKDFGIEKQLQNFIDRFWQRSETEAPWWHMTLPGQDMTIMEERLLNDPVGFMVDVYSGKGDGKAADMLLTRRCANDALAGDMAQKNLVSAFVGEVAKRSAGADFAITTCITPYFQYATNRMGKILNTVAPISTLHYLATQFFTEGPGGTMRIAPWSDTTFQELGLDEVQVMQNLRQAIYCDMCHMGGTLVAMMLAGLALTASGILEPPEEDEKKGNFEEWTFFGLRVNANWWIEDSMGIALPLACFWASAMRGEPRVDLMINGITHYLGNNPVAKVADAAAVLFDPMAELYREYDQDVEGYAKAMGGPPDIWSILKGKTTSFGLSYASQFITPGILKEFYQAGQGNEVAYKRIFETDATGKLTMDARENNRTMYTSYEDATIRKFTKDNPVMGFLADVIIRPETGYMNHEMPDRIIYEPEQMNSVQAFSMYEDPYTKKIEKSPDEQYATALMVIATLQGNTTEELKNQGFMIDYDTKKVVGQVIWDMIATENDQWAELEQNGALSYYNAGYGTYDDNVRVISEMRQCHKAYIQNLKDLYHNKLWSDDLKSVAMYNQENTKWAQDVNGDWYATGFAPTVMSPFLIAPGESPGEYQHVMSRENDWETESVITGNPTGQRALIPYDLSRLEMPDKPKLENSSSDGSNTGHSDLYNAISENMKNGLGIDNDKDGKDKNGKNPYGNKYPKRSYGGGGGGRRGGGGGGGGRRYGSGVPNAYAPSVSAPTAAYVPKGSTPRLSLSKTMNTDNLVRPNEQYLRPDFETKGSREAYKRSDI